MSILIGIYNEEILKDVVRQQNKDYLIPIIKELNMRNTLPNLVVQTIEEYDDKGEVLTMDKLMEHIQKRGYKSKAMVSSTLSVLRDYLAIIVIEYKNKVIRLSKDTDFEKGGFFYVPEEKVEKYVPLVKFDKDVLKDMVLRDNKAYLIQTIESLDKKNTLPNLVVQIIEEYDNKSEVLTMQKLLEELADKGYRSSGAVNTTLTVLRDYLNLIVTEGSVKNRIIRLVAPKHVEKNIVKTIQEDVITKDLENIEKSKIGTDKAYRFVSTEQLLDISKYGKIVPSPRKDVIEGMATFVTTDIVNIIEIVQPMDYDCKEGFILTLDIKGINFKPDPNYIGESNMWSWYTTEEISAQNIIDIEHLHKSDQCE